MSSLEVYSLTEELLVKKIDFIARDFMVVFKHIHKDRRDKSSIRVYTALEFTIVGDPSSVNPKLKPKMKVLSPTLIEFEVPSFSGCMTYNFNQFERDFGLDEVNKSVLSTFLNNNDKRCPMLKILVEIKIDKMKLDLDLLGVKKNGDVRLESFLSESVTDVYLGAKQINREVPMSHTGVRGVVAIAEDARFSEIEQTGLEDDFADLYYGGSGTY